jgi:hypothetical protein
VTAHPDDHFYEHLAALDRFPLVGDFAKYVPAPDSWAVVISDVRGSTRAIENGRYKDVNLLGVAAIVTVQNALNDLEVPFVFGGDGATLLVPMSHMDQVALALRGLKRRARSGFGLEMRAAVVPMSLIREAGYDVKVARFQVSASVSLAMFAGGGLVQAERWVKDPERGAEFEVSEDGDADEDLSRLECRWQPIPSRHGEVVSLLVYACATDEAVQSRTYLDVIDAVEHFVMREDGGRPVAVESLRPTSNPVSIASEGRLVIGKRWSFKLFLHWLEVVMYAWFGQILFWGKWKVGNFDGKTYKNEVVENTDFRKFDHTLRMVLDLSPDELSKLSDFLEQQRVAGRLAYGIHRSRSALMTCVVTSHAGNHVHFVDGADGGYALAAKQLKQQLSERPGPKES